MIIQMHLRATTVAAAVSAILLTPLAHAATTLTGWALMPANTFAPGPTSAQFVTAPFGNPAPLPNHQPVQGLSAVLRGPTADSFYVMPDNGYGAKANSADAMLRMVAVAPRFKMFDGTFVVGTGSVEAVDYRSGAPLPFFTNASFISLRDPDHKLGFALVADQINYPNGSNDIPVDASVKDTDRN